MLTIYRRSIFAKGWNFTSAGYSSGTKKLLDREGEFAGLRFVSDFTDKSDIVHYPVHLHDWRSVDDKDAGEDEQDVVRKKSDWVTHDTKLYKVETASGEYIAIHTASCETLIQLATANATRCDPEFWDNVMSRAEYISSSMSVKKIRLMLKALSNASGQSLNKTTLHTLVAAFGKELLYQYHSLTLLSCVSIADSLAKLNVRHQGTLNLLALSYAQNIKEPQDHVPEQVIASYSSSIRESFAKLSYDLPLMNSAAVSENDEIIRKLSPA